MSDTTPNLTGASYLGASARDAVTKAKERIAKAKDRFNAANVSLASASGKIEGVCAVMEQEAANLEATVKELLPGSNSQ